MSDDINKISISYADSGKEAPRRVAHEVDQSNLDYIKDRTNNLAFYFQLTTIANRSELNIDSGKFEYTFTIHELVEFTSVSSARSLKNYFSELIRGTDNAGPTPLPDFLNDQICFAATSDGKYRIEIGPSAVIALKALYSLIRQDVVPSSGELNKIIVLPDTAHLLELDGVRIAGNHVYEATRELERLSLQQISNTHLKVDPEHHNPDKPTISVYELLTQVMEHAQQELNRIVMNYSPDKSLQTNLLANDIFGVWMKQDIGNLPSEVKQAILYTQRLLRSPTPKETFEAKRSDIEAVCQLLLPVIILCMLSLADVGDHTYLDFDNTIPWLGAGVLIGIAINRLMHPTYHEMSRKARALLIGDRRNLYHLDDQQLENLSI